MSNAKLSLNTGSGRLDCFAQILEHDEDSKNFFSIAILVRSH